MTTPTTPVRPGLGGCLIGFGVLAFAAAMTTVILTIGIWPGEARLTAPLLCPDDQSEAFVVSDTYSVQPGETTTNFTLYCMGENGQHTEIGFFKPALLLTVLHGAIILGLVLLLGAFGRAKGGPDTGTGTELPPPPPPPPAVAVPAVQPSGSDLPPSGPLIS